MIILFLFSLCQSVKMLISRVFNVNNERSYIFRITLKHGYSTFHSKKSLMKLQMMFTITVNVRFSRVSP
jgi:hypothetical protein